MIPSTGTPPDQTGNPADAINPKPAGWQDYVESPQSTVNVRLTIAGSDSNGVVTYSLDRGSGFSAYACSTYPTTQTRALTNKYDSTGHTYRIIDPATPFAKTSANVQAVVSSSPPGP